jgi:hypothetical protein
LLKTIPHFKKQYEAAHSTCFNNAFVFINMLTLLDITSWGKCTAPLGTCVILSTTQHKLCTHDGNFRGETYQSLFVHIILEDSVLYGVSKECVYFARK